MTLDQLLEIAGKAKEHNFAVPVDTGTLQALITVAKAAEVIRDNATACLSAANHVAMHRHSVNDLTEALTALTKEMEGR